MKKLQKGFTLVELIVVITILAILGTIAFISLQGYSQDAKNSKVTSDLRTIVSAIETGVTDGTLGLNQLVDTSGSGTAVLPTATFASGVLMSSGSLEAGSIDFVALRQNGEDFKDPEQNEYIAAYVSNPNNSDDTFYQVAGQTKNAAGLYDAVVKGNYLKFTNGVDADGLITQDAGTTSTLTTIGVTNSTTSMNEGGLY
jgi:prepilin-type N-terminal cleavage/methylation domain-containing protein